MQFKVLLHLDQPVNKYCTHGGRHLGLTRHVVIDCKLHLSTASGKVHAHITLALWQSQRLSWQTSQITYQCTLQFHSQWYHVHHTHTTVLWHSGFCPGEPMPEETFTHSHLLWSSIISYLLHLYIMIHGILPVQFTCLTVFFHNLSPSFLWCTSWPGTLNFILHTFLHQITVVFSQHMSIPSQPVVPTYVSNPNLSLWALYLELYRVA